MTTHAPAFTMMGTFRHFFLQAGIVFLCAVFGTGLGAALDFLYFIFNWEWPPVPAAPFTSLIGTLTGLTIVTIRWRNRTRTE